MRIIVFGDTQFHPWQETERSTRWVEMLDIIEIVQKAAEDHKASDVVFLGDLFENKRTVRADVLADVYNKLKKVTLCETTWHFLAGNHDYYAGRYTQEALRLCSDFNVYRFITCINEEERVYACPYNTFANPNLNYRFLFTHADIRGAKFASGIATEHSGLDEKLLKARGNRRLVINGHYHIPQVIENEGWVPIVCAGAPFQHNWNDARYNDVPRGIYLLDTKAKEPLTLIPLDQFPKFYNESCEQVRDGVDFVRQKVVIGSNMKARTPIKKAASLSYEDYVPAYVKGNVQNKKKAKRLIRLGKELLQGDES